MKTLKTCNAVIASLLIASLSSAQATPPIQTEAKTGRFQTAFSVPSKLATYGEMIERFAGEGGLKNLDANMAEDGITVDKYETFTVTLTEETYEVYVPPTYTPDKPIGLMVYIPARDTGAPHPQYLPALDDQYMIYIGANLSGNRRNPILRRAPLALHALENMARIYNIDPARVYVAGLSGGGKMAVYQGVRRPARDRIIAADINRCGFPGLHQQKEQPTESIAFFSGFGDFDAPGEKTTNRMSLICHHLGHLTRSCKAIKCWGIKPRGSSSS